MVVAAHQEQVVLVERQEQVEQQEHRGLLELMVVQVHQEHQELLEPVEHRGLMEHQELREHQERVETNTQQHQYLQLLFQHHIQLQNLLLVEQL